MEIAILDDLEAEQERVKQYIINYMEENNMMLPTIECFQEKKSLLSIQVLKGFNIYFLNAHMDGMNVAKKIRDTDQECVIVFFAEGIEHAVDGYKVNASNYILRPITYNKIKETLELCNNKILREKKYLLIKSRQIQEKVLFCDIIRMEYYNHYVYIYAKSGVKKIYQSFAEFSKKILIYKCFLLCNRGVIANMDEIKNVEETEFIMSDNSIISIHKRRSKEVKQIYSDYQFEKRNNRS